MADPVTEKVTSTFLGATPLGWAASGLSFVGSLFSSDSKRREERRQQTAKEQQFGINAAATQFSTARSLSFIPEQAAAIEESGTMAKHVVDSNQAKTEAQLRVNAAAAGVSGDSVNVTIADTERTAAQNKAVITDRVNTKVDQLQVSVVDKAIQSKVSQGSIVDNTSSDNSVGVASLSFLSKYLTQL